MKKSILVASTVLVSAFFVSCKKESNQPGATNITGTWSFVSMDVSSTTSQEYTDEFGTSKTISTSDYTTEDNTGTITIDAAKMTSANLSYSIHDNVHAEFYQDGVSTGSFDAPFDYNSPASNGSATYKVISADSIYFDGGSLFMNGVTTDVTPSGAKLNLQGDILYMTQYVNQTKTQVVSGLPITSVLDAKVIAKLQKQ